MHTNIKNENTFLKNRPILNRLYHGLLNDRIGKKLINIAEQIKFYTKDYATISKPRERLFNRETAA